MSEGAGEPDESRPPRRRVGLVVQIRRWWRSRARHRGIRYWLLVQAPVFLLGLGALFVINGFVIGWPDAYDVTVQIMSPLDTAQRWVAMPLSLAGWLVWPSVTGAVVAYVLADLTDTRRGGALIPEGGDLIPVLGRRGVAEDFARFFEWLHDEDWQTAQSHWERIVAPFLDTDAVSENAGPRLRMHQAVTAAVAFLTGLREDPRCPLCPPPSTPRQRRNRADDLP